MKSERIDWEFVRYIMVEILNIFLLIILVLTIYHRFIRKDNYLPSLFGYKIFIIATGSMQPEINVGDIVFTKKVTQDELQVGDVISFYPNDDEKISNTVIGTYTINEFTDGKKNSKSGNNVGNTADIETGIYDVISTEDSLVTDDVELILKKDDTIIFKFYDNDQIVNVPKSIVKTTVTHRIINIVQKNGTTYYETKGDDTTTKEPILIKEDEIQGKVVFKIKYIGLIAKPIILIPILLIFIFKHFQDRRKEKMKEQKKRILKKAEKI